MRRRCFDVSAVAGVIFAVLGAGLAAADPVRVPGTRVSLQPPPGFSVADKFPGFQRAEAQASIMVTELPVPAAENDERDDNGGDGQPGDGPPLQAGGEGLCFHLRSGEPAGHDNWAVLVFIIMIGLQFVWALTVADRVEAFRL